MQVKGAVSYSFAFQATDKGTADGICFLCRSIQSPRDLAHDRSCEQVKGSSNDFEQLKLVTKNESITGAGAVFDDGHSQLLPMKPDLHAQVPLLQTPWDRQL